MNDLIAQQIGPYQITLKIQQTPTTTLYKAFDTKLGRFVTLQVILPDHPHPQGLFSKIKEQIASMAAVDHPSIAHTLDCDLIGDALCVVYDVVPKSTLKKPLNKTYDWNQATRLMVPIAQALAAAHAKGVLHLGISPASILVSQDGAYFLYDFRIDAIILEQLSMNHAGVWIGGFNSGYAAPELIIGKDVDARADIFAFGMLYYEMLTGGRFNQQELLIDELKLKIQNPSNKIQENNLNLPQPIELMLSRMLASKRQDRFKSMLEVSVLFTRVALGQKLTERMVRKPLRSIRPPLKPAVVRAYIFAVISLLLIIIALLNRNQILTIWQNSVHRTPVPQTVKISNTQEPAVSSDQSEIPTETIVANIQPTSTIEPTASANLTPYLNLPVLLGVPLPSPESSITTDTAAKLITFARWGFGKINHAQLSPDGKTIGLASSIGIFIVDRSDLKTIRYFDTGSWVNTIAFSPKGDAIASGEQDGLVRIWDLSTGNDTITFSGHLKSVNSVSFSPDGTILASGSDDFSVKIWDAKDGRLIQTLSSHVQPVNCVLFSPDGAELLSGGQDFTVKFWDTHSWKQTFNRPFSGKINDIAIIQSENIIVLAENNGNVELYDRKNDNIKAVLTGLASPALSLSVNPNNKQIAAADGNGKSMVWGWDKLRVWEASTNAIRRVFSEGTTYSHQIMFTADGLQIISVNWDNTIQFWDTSNWKELPASWAGSQFIENLTISPDSNLIAVQKADQTIDVYNLSNAVFLYRVKGTLASSRAFSYNNKFLAFISDPTIVKVVLATTGEEVFTLPGHAAIKDIYFSTDGFFLGAGINSDLRIWSMTSGQEIVTKKNFGFEGCTIVYDWKETQLAYVTRFDLIDFPSSRNPSICNTQRVGWMQALEFTRNGTFVAAGGPSQIQVWDYTQPTKQVNMENTNGLSIQKLAISEDGKLLAVGFDDLSIRIWNAATGKEIVRLFGHTNKITGLMFTPDLKYLISGSLDGTLRIWSTK